MSKHDDRRLVACPVCKTVIFSENVYRHFRKVHRRDLSGAEIVEILADTKSHPVKGKEAGDFLERVYNICRKVMTAWYSPRNATGFST